MRVGVSVCELLQNVCVGAQLWVSECGLLHHLRCLHVHACFMYAPCFVSHCVFDFALRAIMLHKNTTHTHTYICVRVWMQEAMGWASLCVTALLFCSVIGVDKEPVTLLLWLVKSGDSASLLTMTLHG